MKAAALVCVLAGSRHRGRRGAVDSPEARVFVDGADRGLHAGRFVHAADERPPTYRIVVGASRSGFIYANLP